MDGQQHGITVGHLLQMQRDLLQAAGESEQRMSARMAESEQRMGARIDRLAEEHRLANGRTGKLERVVGELQKQASLWNQRGSILASFTKAQKAAFSAALLAVAGAVAEGVHRLIPVLFGLLAKAIQQ